MNLSAENIEQIRELVRSGYPLKARDAKDLLGHNDHLVELLEARGRLMLGVEIERDQLKAENEALRESNDKLTRRNGMLEQNVEVMTETHILYTWLRKKCDQPSSDVVAVHMNIGHDWATVHDLDTDLRAMIEREEP